ncbi:MAG: heme biosynthesis protein HemY [Notoacmeibacter sp.]|nr:heme biosynthesis protein HemY [Notoacmeibacter sp.]
MIRILVFLAAVFAIGLGFSWLADRPGTMVITFDGTEYQLTLLVAAVAIVSIVAAIMIAWWILKAIWTSPRTVSRYFRARKRDRGYQSLSTGMIAAGAGDAALARRMNKQAGQNLRADQEPLIHLLDAQTLMLEGDMEGARKKFEAMLDDPETRLLGLRGLYLEAQRLREPDAARHYADLAAREAPQLGWASNAALETRSREGNWDGALKLIDQQASTRQLTKEVANRRRAVMLTAKAMETLDADPAGARNAALHAVKFAPSLVPASVVAAKALVRLNDLRKAAKVLETAWKAEPHPEISQAYVHLRPGDSVVDRLKRAQRLQSIKTYHRESAFAVARAAYEAGEYRKAREALEAVLKQDPREGAWLLLADIEEADTGDQGRVRHWLGKAVRAARDPAWTADGYVSEQWAPFSPVTGRIDAFEWRVPVERLGAAIESPATDDRADVPVIPPAVPAGIEEDGHAGATDLLPARTIEHGPEASASGEADVDADVDDGTASPLDGTIADGEDGIAASDVDTGTPEPDKGDIRDDGRGNDRGGDRGNGIVITDAVDPASKNRKIDALPPVPDDPGVDPNIPAEEPARRFRLF